MPKFNTSHLTEQEEFIAKRREEIIRKKNQAATVTPVTVTPVTPVQPVKKAVVGFANDGSFMERMKAMQKAQSGSSTSASSPHSVNASQVSKRAPESCPPSKQSRFSVMVQGNAEKESSGPLAAKPSIFEEQESTEVDPAADSYSLAKLLVARIAEEGSQAEEHAKSKYASDARYRFLFDCDSEVGDYYERLKTQALGARKRKFDDGDSQQAALSESSESPASSSKVSGEVDPVSAFEQAKAIFKAKALALKAGVSQTFSEEEVQKQKALEEQRMMQDIYTKVTEAKKQASSKKQKKGENKHEYDSDEETDGGTWEHKNRIAEMEKTKQWAMDLTDDGKGKHHLADFLPADELEKFMEKVKAVREGRDVDFSDYSKYRIQHDNIGFKMLQKAGWQEGEGLGTKGEGILEPVNKGKLSFDQSGVGLEKPAEVKKEDDDIECYRKRMMLSYKFRPNPLNNPRRPYY